MIWFTADHHFGHANIIEFCGRPFHGVNDMNEALIAAWNSVVAHDDDVLHLGDVCLGRRSESLEFIRRLNGRIELHPGNHDPCWKGHRKGTQQRDAYLRAGFAAVVDAPEPVVIAGCHVIFSHFPYRNENAEHDRYRDHRPVDRGAWLLHGHVHEAWRQRGRQINVGVDAWAGRPVSWREIAELIKVGPGDAAPVPWGQNSELQ